MSVLGLARQQRDAQASLMDRLTLELSGMWRSLFGRRPATRDDIADFAELVTPVVQQYGAASGGIARDFYERARDEAGETDRFEVPLIEPPPREQIEKSVAWAVDPQRHRNILVNERRHGSRPFLPEPGSGEADRPVPTPESDRGSGLLLPTPRRTRRADPEPIDLDAIGDRQRDDLTGALPRIAHQTGRLTLENAVEQDPRAVAYARLLGGANPCAFCVMLASRGFVYRTEQTAQRRGRNQTEDKYHDNCRCTVTVAWAARRNELPDESRDADEMWRRSGAHFRGREALNALARALAAQRAGRDIDEAVFKGGRKPRRAAPRKRKDPAVPGVLPADDPRVELLA